jgi:hypothetical protein
LFPPLVETFFRFALDRGLGDATTRSSAFTRNSTAPAGAASKLGSMRLPWLFFLAINL